MRQLNYPAVLILLGGVLGLQLLITAKPLSPDSRRVTYGRKNRAWSRRTNRFLRAGRRRRAWRCTASS
jgi:hypothetical protein